MLTSNYPKLTTNRCQSHNDEPNDCCSINLQKSHTMYRQEEIFQIVDNFESIYNDLALSAARRRVSLASARRAFVLRQAHRIARRDERAALEMSDNNRPVTSPISGGWQLLAKGKTKKKKKKKKRSSPIKSGVSEKISIFPVVPPWLHFDFASPAAREPKILVIFVGSRRRRERKLGVLSKISRRTLVYVSKLVMRGGNFGKKCKNTPKI